MKVVKIIISSLLSVVFLAVLLLVGTYFFIFGFKRGFQLFSVLLWANNTNRIVFYNKFIPHKAQITIIKSVNDVYATEGLVVDVNMKNGEIGVINGSGYKRFVGNRTGFDLTKYQPQCTQPSTKSVIGKYGEWVTKIKKGDFVHLEYLVKDGNNAVVPLFYASFVESVPYWDNTSPLCLR